MALSTTDIELEPMQYTYQRISFDRECVTFLIGHPVIHIFFRFGRFWTTGTQNQNQNAQRTNAGSFQKISLTLSPTVPVSFSLLTTQDCGSSRYLFLRRRRADEIQKETKNVASIPTRKRSKSKASTYQSQSARVPRSYISGLCPSSSKTLQDKPTTQEHDITDNYSNTGK